VKKRRKLLEIRLINYNKNATHMDNGYKLSPLSFEVQGQWGEATQTLFKSIIGQT